MTDIKNEYELVNWVSLRITIRLNVPTYVKLFGLIVIIPLLYATKIVEGESVIDMALFSSSA